MTIRLVATDLDDTLLREDHTISERTVETIRKAREQGIYFTFATGRMPASTRPYAQQLGIDVPIITYNGAMIQEALSEEVLYRRVIPVATAREILRWLLRNELRIQVYRRDKLYVHTMNDWTREYVKALRVSYEEVNLLEFIEQEEEGVEKILFFGESDDLKVWGEKFLDCFRGKVHLTRSKSHFLEMIHPEVNKGVALAALAERFGIKREEIMAIGDNLNDIEMIRYAGLGVAIGNARQELKEVADVVTVPNQEDGVAQVIEKYVLGNQG